jgi:hypothetical protein
MIYIFNRYYFCMFFNNYNMRKLLGLLITVALVLTSSFITMPSVSATDVCSDTPWESADFYVETSRASWLMSQSCVDSGVVTTMPQGSVMHVIGKTEGWHKLVTEDGKTGWMWEDYVTSTNKTFGSSEPVVVPEPVVEPVATHDPMYDTSGHKYEDAIWYVYNNEIVGGYEDGSYQPDKTINRAELLKIIVEAAYDDADFASYADRKCFNDVDPNVWYTKYVCFAKQEGIVEGYEDGSFKPGQEIIFVEALKIATVGLGHAYEEGTPWYKNTVEYASGINAIPLDVTSFNQAFKRGQMADMITRMLKYKESKTSFLEYLGDTADQIVTYGTIAAGTNVESLVVSAENSGITSFIYTNETYGFTVEIPSTWVDINENIIPGDEMFVDSTVDEDRYFGILTVGLDYKDTLIAGETGDTNLVYLGDTDEYAVFMRIYYCKSAMPACDLEEKLPWTIQRELDGIPATFTTI